jgi:hypothetical protein
MTKKNVGVWLSMFALIVSIINVLVVCIYNPRAEVEVDYQGILVGSFSILVTVLIGWNIYTAVDIKKEVKRFHDELEHQHYSIESKTALSIMYIFMQLRDSLTEENNDMKYRINYLNYCIVFYGLQELLYHQKSKGNITEDNTLNIVLGLLRKKELTVIPTQLHELLDTYEKLNIPDKNISKELYELISNIKLSVQSK